MKINRARGYLYKTAKVLGDVQALVSAITKKSFYPILKRIGRRIYGKIAARGHNIFR